MSRNFDTIFDYIENIKKFSDTGYTETVSIHNESLTFDIYRLDYVRIKNQTQADNIFSLCKKEDANTQLIICNSLAIEQNVTITPPYRCKGIIIYTSTLENKGSISMTARGAKGNGNNLYLYKLNNQYQIVPKDGALGADRQQDTARWEGPWARGNGYNGTGRQTGGGANGASGHGDGDWTSTTIHEGGGQGSSYSGGSGSGGSDLNHPGTFTIPKPDPGTGAGTDGYGARWSSGWYNRNGGGGAGNPGGRGRYASGYSSDLDGESGTGGLIIIYANRIKGTGTYTANGCKGGGGNKGGGGSGGGSINIFVYENNLTKSQFSVAGGGSKSNGGTGGNGTYTISTLPDKFISFYNYRRNSNLYKNANENVTNIEILKLLKD